MAIVAFLETPRFPESISRGSKSARDWLTEVVEKGSGSEERNSPHAHPKHRYDLVFGIRTPREAEIVLDYFMALRGELTGFRFKDWADFRSCRADREIRVTDQTLGICDGARTVFDFVKHYQVGAASYTRPVKKLVADTVQIGLAGNRVFSGFAVDHNLGTVTFAVPPAAALGHVTAGFEFDVPVRFDVSGLERVLRGPVDELPPIPLIEVML